MSVSPPRPKDLSVNALRAFEAAARLGGFAAAALELGVTPGAVTAQIKTLEAALGARLFERGAKGVELTPLGKRALPDMMAAFDALAEASRRLRQEAAPKQVHIATLPAIAQLWLSPRLPGLREMAPDISVSITAMETAPNLKRAPFDLCLFYDEGPGEAIELDEIFPVCAPEIAARLQSIDDLTHVACLSDATWDQDWPKWLSYAAPDHSVVPRGPVFSLYALAVEEAVNGAGVLMGHKALVAQHLAAGSLVAPFDKRVELPRGLRLWAARGRERGSAAEVVERWLRRA